MNYSENVNNAIQKVNFKENRPFCVNVQFSFGVCDHIGISEAVEGVGIFHQLRKVENGWTFWNKPVEFGATRWLSGSYGCLGMDLLVIGDNLEEFQRAIRNGIELIRSKHYDILKKHKGEIEKAMLTMETNS